MYLGQQIFTTTEALANLSLVNYVEFLSCVLLVSRARHLYVEIRGEYGGQSFYGRTRVHLVKLDRFLWMDNVDMTVNKYQ